MATPRKKPEDKLKVGRPTLYKPEYCQMLIDHMKEGLSIDSFAGLIRVARPSVYEWMEVHPEFSNAKRIGEGLQHMFWESIMRQGALGQLRRLKSEKPVLDEKGNVMLDPNTGQVLWDREYEQATPAQTYGTLSVKNLIRWKDRTNVELTGKDGGAVNFSNLTDEELDKKIDELAQLAKKK